MIFIVFSCKKEDEDPVVPVVLMDYYPVKVGQLFVYDVTEINIDKAVGVFDTTEYQLKEFFESKFTDEEGNSNYRIERYYKTESDATWKVLNIC